MDWQEKLQLIAQINQVFRPGAPVDKFDLFAGRKEQLDDVTNAIFQPGRHVIIYGDRGIGKTSLAKVLTERLSQSGLKFLESGTINCDGSDSFSSLWHKIFRELTVTLDIKQTGFSSNPTNQLKINLEHLLPKEVKPDDIRYALNRLPEKSIIILDEVDRLKGDQITTLLADTIKNLSDHSVNATLVLVGVADSVEELITEHKSIERALVQVPVPRMSRTELGQIIDKGLERTHLTMDEGAKDWVTYLSQGFPYFTHALSLYSALRALEDDRTHIEMNDVYMAMGTTVHKSHTILSSYNKAVSSPQKHSLYDKVLLSCAMTTVNALGFFTPAAVSRPMSIIMGKPYYVTNFNRHLDEFCEEKRGSILERKGEPRKYRYRFENSLMRPFVILHGISNDTLTLSVLNEILTPDQEQSAPDESGTQAESTTQQAGN